MRIVPAESRKQKFASEKATLFEETYRAFGSDIGYHSDTLVVVNGFVVGIRNCLE